MTDFIKSEEKNSIERLFHYIVCRAISYARIALVLLLVLLSASCSSALRNRKERELQQKIAFCETMYSSRLWVEREQAIIEVSSLRSKKAIPLLRAGLNDSYSAIRIQSIRGLEPFNEREISAEIALLALNDRDENVRLRALRYLQKHDLDYKGRVFAQSLIHPDWLIRREAYKGLASLCESEQSPGFYYLVRGLQVENETIAATILKHVACKSDYFRNYMMQKLMDENLDTKINLQHSILVAYRGYELYENEESRIVQFLQHPNKKTRVLALRVLKEHALLRQQREKKAALEESGSVR